MALESSANGLPLDSAHTELITAGSTSGKVGAGIAGVGAVCFLIAIAALLSGSTGFGASFAVGAAITVGIGMFFHKRSATEEQTWEPLELHFPVWGLPLGSLSNVTVVRRCKKPLPDAADVVLSARLTCKEKVRYQVGTDTRTETQEVLSNQLDLVGSIQNNTFTGTLGLAIPTDRGAPTLSLKHNWIFWELSLHLSHLTTIDAELDTPLTVVAVLDNSKREFVDSPPPPASSGPFNA